MKRLLFHCAENAPFIDSVLTSRPFSMAHESTDENHPTLVTISRRISTQGAARIACASRRRRDATNKEKPGMATPGFTR
jgi:hypothetical protein